jgi:hypothetical protein
MILTEDGTNGRQSESKLRRVVGVQAEALSEAP